MVNDATPATDLLAALRFFGKGPRAGGGSNGTVGVTSRSTRLEELRAPVVELGTPVALGCPKTSGVICHPYFTPEMNPRPNSDSCSGRSPCRCAAIRTRRAAPSHGELRRPILDALDAVAERVQTP